MRFNMQWIPVEQDLPRDLINCVDVTIETPCKTRLCNIAMFYHPKRWELLIDKHNYQDCKIIAWKSRTEPYIPYS